MIRPGSRLAHYEILSTLGKGGMGEVWRARDTKLGREVAIKTLPPEFARDRQRLARLEREARSLAALNHANVASIHGFEEDSGQHFLVLELAEGETLEERLTRGPIPRDEALGIALQIAEALEAAHDRGIIHRDLKPANIKVSRDGTVKVLDFGLAKPFYVGGQPADDLPTLTRATEMGAVLGTPAYMSPEQVRGEAIDTRADIWAFGVVLHEMLTGQPLFESRTTADTLARVLAPGPVTLNLPADTPPLIVRLVARCLAERLDERLRHIGDAKIDIRDTIAGKALPGAPTPGGQRKTASIGVWLSAGLVAAAIAIVAVVGWTSMTGGDRAATVERYPIATIQPLFQFPRVPVVAISPNGTQIAYTADEGIVIYSTERGTARRVGAGEQPFFSPDGENLGFRTSTGQLVYVPASGGAAVPLAEILSRSIGAAWGRADRIVFATNEGLFSVAATGGPAELLIAPDASRGQLYFGWPEILPGDRSVLFTILPQAAAAEPQLALLDLESREYRMLGLAGTGAKYTEPGYLLYAEGDRLVANGFDPEALEPDPERVDLDYRLTRIAPSFDISSDGTLVFVPPPPPPAATMVWVDPKTGNEEAAGIERPYIYSRISPDGTRVIGDRSNEDGNRDLYIWDFARGVETRFTTDPAEDLFAVWSNDGETIYFTSDRGPSNRMGIYSRPANGSRPARPHYVRPDTAIWVSSMHPDLGIVAFDQESLFTVGTTESPQTRRLLALSAVALNPVISPDGGWLAYQSNETGQTEVFLRPLDDVDRARFQASASGGSHPIWSPDGRTLYYVDLDGMMQAVAIRYEPEFSLGDVTQAFPAYYNRVNGTIRPDSGRRFDIAPDGRFLNRKTLEPASTNTIELVRNWDAALR